METLTTASSNLNVRRMDTLPTPSTVLAELPGSDELAASIRRSREEIRAVLNGVDDRLLVIVGSCSIHDPDAGIEYARLLADEAQLHSEDLLVVMRAYFEKPRTTVGWKGLINDPHLDGSHDIVSGLRTARKFLHDAATLGLPLATEFLEPISPQYIADLVSWGAIGARTTESQIHRQLSSGLSMPVGFKNGTDGGITVALDACAAASAPQTFLGVDDDGRAALVSTTGNPDTHLILRGGTDGPNYGPADVAKASARLAAAGLNQKLIVDASHANSGKDHLRQADVARELADALADSDGIAGVMLESFLMEGSQKLDVSAPRKLSYGQSVTDACMGWGVTAGVLGDLARGARRRRNGGGS
ncbi:3-deoxy-7-phosphoheptulonate synthase [uncultured Arthrobacter sp.]|uniref:3-deoxy-7-phosphoheptulonate synthase n=1 Tax=uncultured Arthrobacter sp. TaxID=114050 RepID=UPI00260B91D5|nr:3-deoxy-7-phosphoheptulonate synthase [uncultured Arthrobacter sp.]